MQTKNHFESLLSNAGIEVNGNKPGDIQIKDTSFLTQMQLSPSLKAGEAYMAGLWDSEQLDEFFFKLCRHQLDQEIYSKTHIFLYSLLNRFINLQTRLRSQEVAEVHYNLGNDFYRLMLGNTMAYTCAYWKDTENLDEAQTNKFDLVCRKLHLRPGERVLELGCGWGSFAKYMAKKYGCEVVAVNISTEQVNFAKQTCEGLPIQLFLADYRDDHLYNSSGQRFDKVVSIGLCEHIGHRNYHDFFIRLDATHPLPMLTHG
jgi:cyclopropane-fatty-acyl-phospholipid synthase